MEGIVLENYDSVINDYVYREGQIIEIIELETFQDTYAIYYEETLDFIPKDIIRVLIDEDLRKMDTGWLIRYKSGRSVIVSEEKHKSQNGHKKNKDVFLEEHWSDINWIIDKHPEFKVYK
ncbi:hypothetical protein AAGG74_15220 [Bacillus mexicanus]|uniref:hypothetical protein n=1 Tax=Bacillus mexicanus TaxID=2834415 RepID=UPI003D1C3372